MSKKNMKHSNKNTKGGNTGSTNSARRNAKQNQTIDMKKVLIGGAATLAVIALLSVVLIWFYGEPTVARIDGTRLSEGDIRQTMSIAQERIWTQHFDNDNDRERGMREEAARVAALVNLYENHGRRLGVSFSRDMAPTEIINAVTQAIIDDPAEFANFEQYMPEETNPEAEQRAADILARAQAGEDFYTLMHEYSEDFGGLAQDPNGYTFISGQMVPEFEEGTLALEIGEISGLVQSQFGFHIIQRIEPDPDNVMHGVEAPEDELLGAKHILIAAPRISPEARMNQAVGLAFEARLENANLVFLSALYDIPLE